MEYFYYSDVCFIPSINLIHFHLHLQKWTSFNFVHAFEMSSLSFSLLWLNCFDFYFQLRFSHSKCEFELLFAICETIRSHFVTLLMETQREKCRGCDSMLSNLFLISFVNLLFCNAGTSPTRQYIPKWTQPFTIQPKWMEKCRKFTSQMVSLM